MYVSIIKLSLFHITLCQVRSIFLLRSTLHCLPLGVHVCVTVSDTMKDDEAGLS